MNPLKAGTGGVGRNGDVFGGEEGKWGTGGEEGGGQTEAWVLL